MANGKGYTHHLKDAMEIVDRTPAKTVQAMLLAHGTCNAEKISALELKASKMTDQSLATAIKRDQPKQAVKEIVKELPEIKWVNRFVIVVGALLLFFKDELVSLIKGMTS